jgi:hypothetical protein
MSGVIISDIASDGRRTVTSVVSRRGSGRPDVEADRPERLRRGDVFGADESELGAGGLVWMRLISSI